jgi:hypothetical protein
MGMHLSVRIVFGAVFTLRELENARRKDIIYMDESEHPHLAHGSENDGAVHYMWVKGTHQYVVSEGGGYTDDRAVAPLDSFKKGDEAQHRRNFVLSCEEFGLPVKEPAWLILWGWH